MPTEERPRSSRVTNQNRWTGSRRARAAVRWQVFALIFWGCGAAVAFAQQTSSKDLAQMSLEELMKIQVGTVYGASKFEQKVTEAPSSVTIVTAEEIQKYGYRTLADLLQSVPGFYVTNDRNYSYAGMDGISRPTDYNTHFLILIDGHRMNDDIFDGAYIGTEGILDVDLIERVEIIRGPGSSLYGTNAFLGVINIITKRGRDWNGVEISGNAGSLQTYETRATYGQQYGNGLELLVSGTGYDSKGNGELFFPAFDSPATNNGIAANVDGDKFASTFASASYGSFTFRTAYVSREKHLPTASFGSVFDDPRTETTDQRAFGDLEYQRKVAESWELDVRGYYDWYKYDGLFVYDYAATGIPPFTVNDDYERGNWAGFEASASSRIAGRHHVTVGTTERFDIGLIMGNYDQQPYASYLYDRHSATQGSVYAQDEFAIRKDLLLSAGLRYDGYSTFGGTVNPRLGLIFSPQEATDIKLLYGRAFRAPDDYQLNYTQPSAGFEPNPGLRPEKIQTTELVFERYLRSHASLSAAGFYNRIDDLISQAYDPNSGLIYFDNLQGVRGEGLEFQFSEKRPSGWEGRVSYTLQSSRSTGPGGDLSNSPKQLAKANVIVPLVQKKLFLGMEGQEVSRRETVNNTWLGGYLIANFTVYSREVLGRLQLSASLYNAFHKRYEDAVGQEFRQNAILQDGRAFRAKVTYRFRP